jgi:hypothetical protein
MWVQFPQWVQVRDFFFMITKIEKARLTEYGYYQGEEFIRHREDGPAVECENGDKWFYINGKLHREGKPFATASGRVC